MGTTTPTYTGHPNIRKSKLPSMRIANFKHANPTTFVYSGVGMAPRLHGNAVIVHPERKINENSYGGLVD